MRTRRDPASPWGQTIWFESHEFDLIMDESRQRADVPHFTAGRGVDVEAVLERAHNIVPDYIPLPEGILGKTHFHGDGRCEVFISRELSEAAEHDDVARRRFRSTLAHECAHVVMHTQLYLVDTATQSLFGDPPPDEPKIMCRGDSLWRFRDSGSGYDGKWWEYQANRGMASLLLPKRETLDAVRSLLDDRGFTSLLDAAGDRMLETIVREIMRMFDVSMQVVNHRLQELGALPNSLDQMRLQMEE